MMRVLLLVHRIPFPPDKGDKIRSYHLLRHLARRHTVFLGAFVDDVQDWQYAEQLKQWCAEICLRPLRKPFALMRSATALVTGLPLSIPYYHDSGMRAWVANMQRHNPVDRVVVFSSTMAQYLGPRPPVDTRWIADLVDVDSDKWSQYAQKRSGLRRWVYAREAILLASYERDIIERFDRTFLVSKAEAELLRSRYPELTERIDWYNNGVDTDYFDPDRMPANSQGQCSPTIVFTGAMDYWANVDAVVWFARNVLPRVRDSQPDARFLIVGSRPTKEVKALEIDPAVTVTGRVQDVRPYLGQASVAVAPMRIARGIQNKVLEAMAMRLSVVCTSSAASGLDLKPGVDIAVADDPLEFARAVLARLHGNRSVVNREFVLRDYSWSAQFDRLDLALS